MINVCQNLQFIGLLYDVAGVLALGIPFATKRLKIILEEAASKWDHNIDVEKNLIGQRLDTGVGTVLLVVGFLLQAGAQIWQEVPLVVGTSLLGLLVLGGLSYLVVRGKLRQRDQAKLKELRDARN